MIAYLCGTLMTIGERSCVVLTGGGVGYEVSLTETALARLPQKGGEIAFHIETIVREDALDLYGFESADERSFFQVLISISKLGPRKAQAILSRFAPEELRRIVSEENLGALTSVSGIGKKTGQQILLELKYKLDKQGLAFAPSVPQSKGVFTEALSGLTNLGYDESDAGKVLREVLDTEPDLDVTSLLRQALKKLAQNR